MNDIAEAEKKLKPCKCGGRYKIDSYLYSQLWFADCCECHRTLTTGFDTLGQLVEAINLT